MRPALRSLRRAERLYAWLAVLLCLAMLAGRSVGAADDGLQGSFSATLVSPSSSGIVALAADALPVSAATGDPGAAKKTADTDLLPAALPSWIQPAPERTAAEDIPGPTKVRDISPGLVSADYAIVIDGASGKVLWARDANTPVPPASITKIVTALVVLDHARITDLVTVGVDSQVMIEDSVMGLSPGEVLTVEDLLYGMMLPSGNDAALALADYVGGTREAFARLMNEKAHSLGLTGSSFVNPHGRDAFGHLTTAYDMAMLAREGMRSPIFQRLASARSYETPRGRGYQMGNLNQLLWRYPGADGVKIGYDDAAGKTIVGSAVRDGHRVYVAMMRSADIFSDSRALLDWTFASYDWS
ncbi:MAG: Serine-type D-Ala-D-Ala carboxypeptidase [Chloroflexi bacterium]|nr:Serine-type D-Ala-D-Ala carboxypeptidase [Chloroflexota bacterium]